MRYAHNSRIKTEVAADSHGMRCVAAMTNKSVMAFILETSASARFTLCSAARCVIFRAGFLFGTPCAHICDAFLPPVRGAFPYVRGLPCRPRLCAGIESSFAHATALAAFRGHGRPSVQCCQLGCQRPGAFLPVHWGAGPWYSVCMCACCAPPACKWSRCVSGPFPPRAQPHGRGDLSWNSRLTPWAPRRIPRPARSRAAAA